MSVSVIYAHITPQFSHLHINSSHDECISLFHTLIYLYISLILQIRLKVEYMGEIIVNAGLLSAHMSNVVHMYVLTVSRLLTEYL